MKSILTKGIAFILLAVMLCMSAIGCAKDPDVTPDDETGVDSSTESESFATSDSTQAPAETEGAALSYDLSKFTIIRGYESGELATNASTNLYNALKKKGIRPERPASDSEVAVADGALEILVGATDRADSKTVAAKLTEDNQFAISFRKSAIVITAKRNASLDIAVTYFLENYVANAESGVITANENHTYIGTVNLIELGSTGTSKYTIVYSASQDLGATANILTDRLKSRLKAENVTCTDDFEEYAADSYLILIGNVNELKYPELAEVKEGWAFPEYGIKVVGNRIYLIGNTPEAAKDAVNMMASLVTRQAEEADGKYYIAIPDEYRSSDEALLVDFPQFDGTMKEVFMNPNDEMVYSYRDVTADQYTAYVAALNAAGYVTTDREHTIGRNSFATGIHPDKGQVHVAYYPTGNQAIGEMQLFVGKLEDHVAMPRETYDPSKKITETTFHVMSLDYKGGEYASTKALCDGSGLTYVVTLEDGRFVIFDGGFTVNDGHNLYNYLNAINQRTDGIKIAAWFISHAHGDHYGGCEAFVANYADKVTIDYFVVNAPSEERAGKNWFLTDLSGVLRSTNAKLIKPHTGQVMKLCNTEFEIVLTHENLGQSSLGDFNNTSTVVRMIENGKTVMITADASQAACNKLISLYGTSLKSDILQLNHHGVSGGTKEFYEAVNPSIALWTTSEDSFAGHEDPNAKCHDSKCKGKTGRINGGGNGNAAAEGNLWIRDNVGIENCYVADDMIEWITFVNGEIKVNDNTGYYVQTDIEKTETSGLLQIVPAQTE